MAPPRRRVQFALPSIRTAAAKLTVAFVFCSVVGYLIEKNAGVTLGLVPATVITDLTLWQLVTYIPIDYSPMGIIFGALVIWQMGGQLEQWWGTKRLLTVSLTVVFLAGLLTVALSLLVRSLRLVELQGGWALAGSIWVLYGLRVGRGQTNFWGIPVTGDTLAAIGAGFVLLIAIFGSWQAVVPEALALGCCYVYMRVGTPRDLWLKAQSWRLEQQVRKRSKKLRMISGERNMRSDSDRFLH